MTTDNSKGLSTTYNILNLPNVNTLSSGAVSYVYDATGTKLRRLSTVGSTVNTDYVSGIQYTNGSIEFIQTETGRALNNSGTYAYEYNLSDNLGNSRLSFNSSGVTTQQDNYLPFGYDINVNFNNPKNQYLYNGKELQVDLGLYDYGARCYDPVIARWTSVDGLAEISRRWSTYTYGEDNPIRNVDRDGMSSENIVIDDARGISTFLSLYGNTKKASTDENKNEEGWLNGVITPKNAPKLNPLKGFWEKLSYALNGRSFNHISYDSDGNPTGYTPITGAPDLITGPVGEIDELTHAVYYAKNFEEEVVYVGITNNIARRAIEQLAAKGIKIIPLMENLRPEEARAVEQALIQIHGLEKKGGSLVNLINSISKTNPKYAKSLARGYELLEWIGYYAK